MHGSQQGAAARFARFLAANLAMRPRNMTDRMIKDLAAKCGVLANQLPRRLLTGIPRC